MKKAISKEDFEAVKEVFNTIGLQRSVRIEATKSPKGETHFSINWAALGNVDSDTAVSFAIEVQKAAMVADELNKLQLTVIPSVPDEEIEDSTSYIKACAEMYSAYGDGMFTSYIKTHFVHYCTEGVYRA